MKIAKLYLVLTILYWVSTSKIIVSNSHDIETTDGSRKLVEEIFPALGFDLKSGPLWNIICITKKWGRIPGKLAVDGRAYFVYEYRVYFCELFFKTNGRMIWNAGKVPKNCKALGKQQGNNLPLYTVLAVTQYGNIPGKSSNPNFAIFSNEGIRFTSKKFYWVC